MLLRTCRGRTLAAVVCWLLTCSVISGLWIRSGQHYDAVGFWPNPAGAWAAAVISDEGTVGFASVTEGGSPSRSRFAHSTAQAGRSKRYGAAHGFIYERVSNRLVVGMP